MGVLLLAGAFADDRVVLQLDIEQPRTFGYHIGDRFSRLVHLQLRQPYTLSVKALPAAGRFSEWLALEAPQLRSEQRGNVTDYEIRFDYQLVNVGSEPDSIAVPHHELVYSDGHETLKSLVPAARVSVAPLRARDDASLQADQAPAPRPFDVRMLRLCVAAASLSLLALLYVHGGLPSWRTARPFTVAQRALRTAQRHGWRDEDYDAALRAVHRAFNETAGRTLFADTLAAFFSEHAAFAALRAPVTEFYARSREHFYTTQEGTSAPRYTARELAALVRRCRDVERGLR